MAADGNNPADEHVCITDVPGVGKSTNSGALGMYLIERGHRVAVPAVDPSSTRTGASILGDKTRMVRFSCAPRRLHPSGPHVGNPRWPREARRPALAVEVLGCRHYVA